MKKNMYTDVVFLLIGLYLMQLILTQLILQSTVQNLSVLRNLRYFQNYGT